MKKYFVGMPSGADLVKFRNNVHKIPGGRTLITKLISLKIPYSGSVSPDVLALEEGFARVAIDDVRAHRNHLNSIHAMAIANVGEVATGLAILSRVPKEGRAILKKFTIEYLKKARGRITAEARSQPFSVSTQHEEIVLGEVTNNAGEVLAKVEALWVVGPNTVK